MFYHAIKTNPIQRIDFFGIVRTCVFVLVLATGLLFEQPNAWICAQLLSFAFFLASLYDTFDLSNVKSSKAAILHSVDEFRIHKEGKLQFLTI